MDRVKVLDFIPTDLILEIFSRLPAKSIARFRCVSKPWRSLLRGKGLTELFLTRSRARPRLFLVLERDPPHDGYIFSVPQPRNPYESSLEVTADFHMSIPYDLGLDLRGHNSGLICFTSVAIPEELRHTVAVICNPNMEKYAILPSLERYRKAPCFLGFDPIGKQYKVLFMAYPYGPDGGEHRIITLGTGQEQWRKIHCPIRHKPPWLGVDEGICINGVLYYEGEQEVPNEPFINKLCIVCFDFRSETFWFIDTVCKHRQLINYKGRLGGLSWEEVYTGEKRGLYFTLWVLEDVEEQIWSKHIYTLWDDNIVSTDDLVVNWMTVRGELVLLNKHTSNPFYVFFFNPERDTLQRVEIQVAPEYQERFNNRSVYAFVDFVEDLNVNDSKLLRSSTTTKYYDDVIDILTSVTLWKKEEQAGFV